MGVKLRRVFAFLCGHVSMAYFGITNEMFKGIGGALLVLVLIALAVDVCLENNPPQRKLANFEDWKWLHIGESIDGGSVEFTEASKKSKERNYNYPVGFFDPKLSCSSGWPHWL